MMLGTTYCRRLATLLQFVAKCIGWHFEIDNQTSVHDQAKKLLHDVAPSKTPCINQKCWTKNFTIFKLEPTTSNLSKHVRVAKQV